MNGSELRELIGIRKPRYKEQYKPLFESISQKGDNTGKGSYSSFGAYYQTFMYAFIIGYRLHKCIPLRGGDGGSEKLLEFAPISSFKPVGIKDYIIAILLNESEKFDWKWIELENAKHDAVITFVQELVRRMEGYANAGFEYLQEKWDNEKVLFQSPFVFVDILEDLDDGNNE